MTTPMTAIMIASPMRWRGMRQLAGLVLALGLLQAAMTMNPTSDPRPTVRPADTSNLVAMTNARQPDWVMFANPILGAAGVLAGAAIRKR